MFSEKTKNNLETVAKNVSAGLAEIAVTGAIGYIAYEYSPEMY